jgi:hypothetical protein
MLLRYWLKDCEMVPVAPVIPGIIAFTFQMHRISIVKSLYFRIFSVSFFFTFLSPEIIIIIIITYLQITSWERTVCAICSR